ncbi:putative nuclease HARBI1 [Chanodichthys erythropterus]|uniref:putative nuclease HARBI1 n=1 Tax=Chanodichthys erythropterus TaxID=933992 RepID=UPI00351E1A08
MTTRTNRYLQLNERVPVLDRLFDGTSDLKADFRVSRQSLFSLIQILRRPSDQGWRLEIQVSVFVYWLASATSYRLVANTFHIPRATVHRIVHRIAKAILGLLDVIVTFPRPEDLPVIGQGFAALTGSPVFQNAVGSIDGCQVRIKTPSEDVVCYLNRKLFHSINLQAMCDHKMRFLDIFVGYPGSVHDSRVLKNSPFFTQQKYPPQGYYILADGGYPCLSQPVTIITPYREPVNDPAKRRFNRVFSRGRCIIERAFGVMKSRWRSIFFKALEVHHTFAPKVIACCCVLHNICIDNRDTVEIEETPDSNDDGGTVDEPEGHWSGENLRGRLVAELSGHHNEHNYCACKCE